MLWQASAHYKQRANSLPVAVHQNARTSIEGMVQAASLPHLLCACLQIVQPIEDAVKAAEEVHPKPSLLHIALLGQGAQMGGGG